MFMRGTMPLRRTLFYLNQGKILLRDEIKIFTIATHTYPEPPQSGAREFVFWHWSQLKFKNPHVQFVKMTNVCIAPFALAILDDGREVPFDLECREKDDISEAIQTTLGKSALVWKREHLEDLQKQNPANFGSDCKRQCMCEIQGQRPCTSLIYAPKYMTGSWRWNHNTYKEDWPKIHKAYEGIA